MLKYEAVRQQLKEKTEEQFKTMQDSNDIDQLWTEMKSVITEVAEDTCGMSKPKFRIKVDDQGNNGKNGTKAEM